MTENTQSEYQSLYDYLGRKAGKELGRLVADYAKIKKFVPPLRKIEHSGYNGYVNTYSKEFLDEFFNMFNLFGLHFAQFPPTIDNKKEQELIAELNTELMNDNLFSSIKEDEWNGIWKEFDKMFLGSLK